MAAATSAMAQEGQNNPYVDDKLFHLGFSVGVDFGGYGIRESGIEQDVNGDTSLIHARTSAVGPGFSVGFITDVRLCRFLNLRFCPSLHFGERSISFKADNPDVQFIDPQTNEHTVKPGEYTNSDFAIPMDFPIYLKFSAARERNYRPYVITGGGVSVNVNSFNKQRPICTNLMDYFFEIGFGVDTYFRWFKFCPELKYHIGFNNQLYPNAQEAECTERYYMGSIGHITNHVISLVFNFE